jgi:hypothetical protein
MSSKDFDFSIKNALHADTSISIGVKNAQIEIDGGYEGKSKLALIEAKNTQCDDFLIRQLYYPYRVWNEKVNKEVLPVFMTFSNDVFSFFIYQFQYPNSYNSLVLVEQRDFILAPEPINLQDIKLLANKTPVQDEPASIPFPQADDFSKVVDLLGVLVNGDLTKEEIANNYAFDRRQADYYYNAARYLGLASSHTLTSNENAGEQENKIALTAEAKHVMGQKHKEKYLALAQKIVQHKPFHDTLNLYLAKTERPTIDEVVLIMKACKLGNIHAETTLYRRAQTILKRVERILSLDDEA